MRTNVQKFFTTNKIHSVQYYTNYQMYKTLLYYGSAVAVVIAFMLPEVDRLSILFVVAAALLSSHFFDTKKNSTETPLCAGVQDDEENGETTSPTSTPAPTPRAEGVVDPQAGARQLFFVNETEEEFLRERDRLVRDRRRIQPIGDREKFAEFLLRENTELRNRVNAQYFT